jgi:hypothetical protein
MLAQIGVCKINALAKEKRKIQQRKKKQAEFGCAG